MPQIYNVFFSQYEFIVVLFTLKYDYNKTALEKFTTVL